MKKINRMERLNFEGGKTEGFVPETAVNEVYLSKPAPLYASYDNGAGELIGYGHEFKFQLDQIENAVVWSTVAGVAIVKPIMVYQPQGEVYTNFDKRPQPSALEQSVTLALRRLKQEQKALEQQRADIDRAALAKSGLASKNPPPEPEDEPAEPPIEDEAPPAAPDTETTV